MSLYTHAISLSVFRPIGEILVTRSPNSPRRLRSESASTRPKHQSHLESVRATTLPKMLWMMMSIEKVDFFFWGFILMLRLVADELLVLKKKKKNFGRSRNHPGEIKNLCLFQFEFQSPKSYLVDHAPTFSKWSLESLDFSSIWYWIWLVLEFMVSGYTQ